MAQQGNISDDENPMPSSRSTAPSITVANRDDILLPPEMKRQLKPNNHRLNLGMRLAHPIITEILQNHPLRFAFTLEHRVPAFYLQQLWYSMEYVPEDGNHHFNVQIDEYVSYISAKRLRRILRLPAPNDVPGRDTYEDLPTEEEMCAQIRALGYDESEEPLQALGNFKRMYLPQLYFTLFSLVNRCLTGKQTGMDKASTAVMRIFLGIIYSRHFDYAQLIWTDLVEYAIDRTNARERDFIPYQRFLQLAIHHIMNRQPAIPRRQGTPKGPSWEQKYLKLNNKVFAYVMPLPEALLSLANQDAPSVIAYRESIGLMAPQQPAEPAQEPPQGNINELGEGPVDLGEQVQEQGVPEQGDERENIVRGQDEGGALDLPNPTTAATTAPVQPPPKRPRLKLGVSRQHIRNLPPVTDSDSETESDDRPIAQILSLRRRIPTSTQPSTATTEVSTAAASTSAEPPIHETTSTAPEPEPLPHSPNGSFDFEHSLDDIPIPDFFSEPYLGEIRREEGDIVENENVSERRESTKVIASAESTTPIQVTATDSHTHSLGMSTGQDAVDLAAQLHAPPSHFVDSQQPTTSEILVGLAPYLAKLHSGVTAIETRSSIPPTSTSFLHTSSIEPPRTQASLHTESLRDPVGTSVVMPTSGLRGSEGNPASANIMPTLSAGHTVYSTVVSTDILRGSGVTITPPSFTVDPATQAFVEAQHKKALDSLAQHEEAMKAFGKDLISQILSAVRPQQAHASTSRPSTSRPSTSRSPPPPPRQSSSSSEDTDSIFGEDRPSQARPSRAQFNRHELMSMLYADLLAEATALGHPEGDLQSLLRRLLAVPTVTRQEFDSFQHQVNQRLSDMEAKQDAKSDEILSAITALRMEIQQSCRPAARPRRPDQDDPDSAPPRPEGETGRRVTRTQQRVPATTTGRTSPSAQPSRKRQRQSETQEVETPTVEKPAADFNFESYMQEPQEETVNVQSLRDSVKNWFTDVYEPVLKEADYVNLMHTEKNYVPGSASQPNLLPHQIRFERIQDKWVNQQIRTPYLEETMDRIFVKNLKNEDQAKVNLITEMDPLQVTEYVSMLVMKAKDPEEVISRHRIVNIISIGSTKVLRVEFPTFKVRRADGKVYEFSEADFASIDVVDMELLYTELKRKINRNKEEQRALRAIIRHVQKEIRYSYIHDFQRGIESQIRKVNLLKPNQNFPNLQNLKVLTIVHKPAHGMVYMVPSGEKRFLRFEELPAYSDGTLWAIRNRISAELSSDRKSSDRMPHTKRENLLDAIERIDNKIMYRQTLRIFEGMFERRR